LIALDFAISDTQASIAELARTLFTDFASDERVRDIAKSGIAYDKELWTHLVEAGLTSLMLPDADGGGGLGIAELLIVLEEQGRALAQVPLWRHSLAGLVLARFAVGKPRDRLLPAIAVGEIIATVSIEGIAAPALTLAREGSSWRLSGRVATLPYPRDAAIALVPARLGDQIRLVVLPLDAEQIVRADGIMTHGEPIADLSIDGLALPDDYVLPSEANADWLFQRAAACVAALQLGVAIEAMRRTAEYSVTRKQFGRPIGSFQGVALRAADGYIDTEVTRGPIWQLAWRLDEGLDARAAAHVAKYWANQCGHRVAHTAAHLHGGLGADVSYPMHRFLLWARALEMTAGGAQSHLFALGELVANEQTKEAIP
jgi:alkylation response protein AidB-like acyl-CoA dehydrogenase